MGNQSVYELLPGGSDPEPPSRAVAFERATLPPQWVDFFEEAQEAIRCGADKLDQLKRAHQRRLLNVFSDDVVPDEEVKELSSQLEELIRRCEKSIHQVKSQGGTDTAANEEYRKNVQRKLATQLSQLSKSCREAQREYRDAIQKRQQQQQGSRPGGVDLEAGDNGADGRLAQQQMLMQVDHNSDLSRMEASTAQWTADVCQTAASLHELNEVIKELQTMVIHQGSILDRIDHQMDAAVDGTAKAKNELNMAAKAKKQRDDNSLRCMLVFGVVNLILLFVLLLKYKVKYNWSFLSMLSFMIMMCLAGGSAFAIVRFRPGWCHTICPMASRWLLPSSTDPNASEKTRWQRAKSAMGFGSGGGAGFRPNLGVAGIAVQGAVVAQGLARRG